MPLNQDQRAAYKAQAHHLKPVVLIGNDGVHAAVLNSIEQALKAHELIKIKLAHDDRAVRQTYIDVITAQLAIEVIQSIGKMLVVYRLNPEKNQRPSLNKGTNAPREVKVRKATRGTRRGPLKTFTVLGNQRVTAGGLLRKKKDRMLSLKKIHLES